MRTAISVCCYASFIASLLVTPLCWSQTAESDAKLEPAAKVLESVLPENAPSAKAKSRSEAETLLEEINAFRTNANQLPPDKALTQWLTLWDKAAVLDTTKSHGDYRAVDQQLGSSVSLFSVVASVPGPGTWQALRTQAQARYKNNPKAKSAAGLKLFADTLASDHTAVIKTLDDITQQLDKLAPDEKEKTTAKIQAIRAAVSRLHQTPALIETVFLDELNRSSRGGYGEIEVPDLVNLLGAAKAESLLQQALEKPISISDISGETSKALARKLALERIDTLRKPQWNLIDSMGTLALYEAMLKRFDPAANKASSDDPDGTDYSQQRALAYYFLDLVVAGRKEDAGRALKQLAATSRGSFDLPNQGMEELVKHGFNKQVYAFLGESLKNDPSLPFWDLYLEQAAYSGQSKQALELLTQISERKDLPPYLKASIQLKRIDGWLASDQLDSAIAAFQQLLSIPPSRDDPQVDERTAAALKLASIGRLINNKSLTKLGLNFAEKARPFLKAHSYDGESVLFYKLIAELRRNKQNGRAQQLLVASLKSSSAREQNELYRLAGHSLQSKGWIELASLYADNQQWSDVVHLIDNNPNWTAADLSTLIDTEDSLKTPLGLIAARALAKTGKKQEAETLAAALVRKMPQYDPAYELLLELIGSRAQDELDRLYRMDAFEERPLIWKSLVLFKEGRLDEAEKTAKTAIALDPSDGEQGKNDRMRIYGVYADILEAKGDAKNATLFRNAVKAIRISEQADDWKELGLYQRAFEVYRQALAEFNDAYCIQSRLAVQLGKLGFHEEASKHYQRAFELMPDSFGKIESHCFGCENIFSAQTAQRIAEKVFTEAIARQPEKPQTHYMLGYLRKEQERYNDALVLFSKATDLDPTYLSAWMQIYRIGENQALPTEKRDTANLKLLTLDPARRHVKYSLDDISDLATLWRTFAELESKRAESDKPQTVYPLVASTRNQEQILKQLPSEAATQMQLYMKYQQETQDINYHNFGDAIARHNLTKTILLYTQEGLSEYNFDY